jgi:hypothetical protein
MNYSEEKIAALADAYGVDSQAVRELCKECHTEETLLSRLESKDETTQFKAKKVYKPKPPREDKPKYQKDGKSNKKSSERDVIPKPLPVKQKKQFIPQANVPITSWGELKLDENGLIMDAKPAAEQKPEVKQEIKKPEESKPIIEPKKEEAKAERKAEPVPKKQRENDDRFKPWFADDEKPEKTEPAKEQKKEEVKQEEIKKEEKREVEAPVVTPKPKFVVQQQEGQVIQPIQQQAPPKLLFPEKRRNGSETILRLPLSLEKVTHNVMKFGFFAGPLAKVVEEKKQVEEKREKQVQQQKPIDVPPEKPKAATAVDMKPEAPVEVEVAKQPQMTRQPMQQQIPQLMQQQQHPNYQDIEMFNKFIVFQEFMQMNQQMQGMPMNQQMQGMPMNQQMQGMQMNQQMQGMPMSQQMQGMQMNQQMPMGFGMGFGNGMSQQRGQTFF